MTTTKKSYVARLGVLVVALTLVSTCLLGGTMAKYVTDVKGDGTATVAKWSFKANGQDATMTAVDLASTAYGNINNDGGNKIAPGTEGSFDIEIDASGSEVAVDYAITFSNLQNKPDNLTFYSDADGTKKIDSLENCKDLNGTIELADVSKTVTKTVYWKWPYGTSDKVDDNTADNTAGTPGNSAVSFDIVVTGTQKAPEKPTPAP